MTGPVRHRVRVLLVSGPAARRALDLLGRVLDLDADGYRFPHPRLSLSHTVGAGVAAAAIGPAAGIGVDVERLRPADPRTARFFLRPGEEEWLRRTAPHHAEHLRLWTVKEALFKADLANASTTLRDYAVDDPAAHTGLARTAGGARFAYASARRRDTFLTVAAAVRPDMSGDAMPVPSITFEAVAGRLSALLSVPTGRLTPQTSLADVAADSFELVEIVIDLQEEFGVNFSQADLRPVLTLGDLVALLRGSTRAASA